MRFISLLASFFSVLGACAQLGNSPAVGGNNTAIGTNAWANPAHVCVSDNSHTTVAAKGLSNYLMASSFGYGISGPATVSGIQLEVEKSTLNPVNVALLNGWTSGLAKTVSAGTDRCLVVIHAAENGTTSQDVSAMTYGGRSMTQLSEVVIGGGATFSARIEVWILLDAEIALAGSTTIVPTYAPGATLVEYCPTFSAAVFEHVDQLMPASATRTSGFAGGTDPHQLGGALATLEGSMAVNAVLCGNFTEPATPIDGTGTYTINSGYTEGTDIYFANPSFATSGACLQTAHKAIASAGTEQPTCDFLGSVNRHAMIGFTLQRPRELDQEVRLVKGGSIVGTNLASTTPWPTTDGYTVYGGPTELWGQTWTLADVNAPGFGAAMSALVQNGTARIDHMIITVFLNIALPIELVDFHATSEATMVRLDWVTATEHDNDHFVVQRSRDGHAFDAIATVHGVGTSLTASYYTAKDEHPLDGISFYRLKQVDVDGTTTFSDLVSIERRSDDLGVFPNPTNGNVVLSGINLEQDHVEVYTDDMRLVRKHVGAGVNPTIHLEDLPDGGYMLLVRNGGAVRTARVIKISAAK